MAAARDFRALVLSFVKSPEYRSKELAPSVVPIEEGAMVVETSVSAAELSALKDRVRTVWSQLGLQCPHYSVLTHEQNRPETIDDATIDRFYASGRREAETIETVLKRNGITDLGSKVCVEYGCGLGRVTLGLAGRFKAVHGYDISTNHLALARSRADETHASNVEFHLCSAETIIEKPVECDFLYSRLVFQHNPPPIIRELIAASLSSLRDDGVALFQVPTYFPDYSFRVKEYLATPSAGTMEMHCIPQPELFALIAEANCQLLEVRETVKGVDPNLWISGAFLVRRLPKRGWKMRRASSKG
jgi:SAM-dependent methyltransferase